MEVGKRRKGPMTAKQRIERSSNKNAGAKSFQFPSDLTDHQFVMHFVEYSFNDGQGSDSTVASFALPLPGQGINDKDALNYNAQDLGVVGAALSSIVGEAVSKFDNAGSPEASSEAAAAIDYKKETENLMALGGAAVRALNPSQDLKNASDLALGNVVNPHIALLFQSVGLKSFSLNWKLAPASEAESIALKNLIYGIHTNIHPRYEEGENNFFLKYPNQVDLFYVGSGDFLHYFKRAAVTGFDVNYQPEGGNSLFKGTGAPAFVDLTIQFQETEIWTAEDYEELAGGQ